MRETGYFLPHAPISYLGIVVVAFLVWLLVHFIIGVESDFIVLTSIIVVPALFAFWSNRYAKMLWLKLSNLYRSIQSSSSCAIDWNL